MIITCPSCSAQFVVKDDALGATGRKVRCAKCKHDWFQEPDKAALAAAASAPVPEPEKTGPLPEGSNLPVVNEEEIKPQVAFSGGGLYLKLAFAASLLLFLVTLAIVNIGQNYEGFTLADVSIEKTGDDKKDLLVKGKVINGSEAASKPPILNITFVGENNNKLQEITVDLSHVILNPGEGVDFENRIPHIPENTARLLMNIGNPIDLAGR